MKLCVAVSLAHSAMPDSAVSDDPFVQINSPPLPPTPPPPPRRRLGDGRNDPAAQFHHVTRAFASLDALTNAVAQSFSAPSIAPPRTLIEVALDFDRATDMLIRAQERSDTAAIAFYEAIRQQFISEQARIVSSNVHLDE